MELSDRTRKSSEINKDVKLDKLYGEAANYKCNYELKNKKELMPKAKQLFTRNLENS